MMNAQAPISKRAVLVWGGIVLSRSETFVRVQADAMTRFAPRYVGVRFAGGTSLVPREECRVLNDGGMAGRIREAAFKLAGFAPGYVRDLRAERPAILHAHHGVHGALALPLARSLRIPLVVTFHGADATVVSGTLRKWSLADRVYRRRAAELKDRASLFIAVSEFIKGKLIDQGYPAAKIVVHYIGVDVQTFTAHPTIHRERTVLFVGRLAEKKGCAYLIQAMRSVQARYPDWRLVVLGDGPLRRQLESLASTHLRNYSFEGMQSHETVRQWMNRASVLAVPSVTATTGDSEGLPTVVVEAHAMGLPVVATRHAGIGEAITDGLTGLLVVERDTNALASAITALTRDADLRSRMAETARRQVTERFDVRSQTQILESFYDRIIASMPNAADVPAGAVAAWPTDG